MQTITDELAAILKARFQAGADGFRARLDVSTALAAVPPGSITVVQTAYAGLNSASFTDPVTAGNTVIALCTSRSPTGGNNIAGFTLAGYELMTVPTDNRACYIAYYVVQADTTLLTFGADSMTYASAYVDDRIALIEVEGEYAGVQVGQSNTASTTAMDCGGSIIPPVATSALVAAVAAYGPKSYLVYPHVTPDTDVVELADDQNGPHIWAGYRIVDAPDGATGYTVGGTLDAAQQFSGVTAVFTPIGAGGGSPATATWTSYQLEAVSIDKSLRLVADQADVVLSNEELLLGWGPTSVFTTNQRIRIFQWYGEVGNAVRSFTGIIDKVRDGRDVLKVELSCRDMMAILIDETFSTIGPQEADEDGAIRTIANGVYLSMEVSDIVYDIVVNRAGWPVEDVDITPTSYVLDEFRIDDGQSWADAIIGDSQLTGLVGYSAWADEAGVFHFAPTLASQHFTDPTEPAYVYRAGEDVVSLDDETDQYDLRTRVKVRGPLTTTTLQDTWRELWRTTKLRYPVGIAYRASDSAAIYVIDRGTKRLYRLRQSDRVLTASVYLGGVIPHPLGLSVDPADASVYWVLNAPWIDGGSGGNSVKKVRWTDHVVVASYSLPSGRWSALKVSSSYLYLTNLDTDRFYRRSKADASAIADYTHVVNGITQLNPSGIMVDGTTLYLFWSNGGTTARFLVCHESDPATPTATIHTAGTNLHGGEMDTTTHTECYGDSDSLGLVAKFTLLEAVDQTNEVSTEVVDTDLEDELGTLALLGNREHDTHPDDADHPFEVRRLTLDLSVITSMAQAIETAQRQLDLASVRRRALDVGMVGNPALQKTDLIAVVDPITGISSSFVIDTYRTDMSGSTYLGTAAVLPVADFTDTPTDEGDASEEGS